MAKKKGLSAEEKRQRVLEIFEEKKEVFQLKEIETIASKERGVVPQAVKEILKELVDENLVDSDKIGTSVYYWAFPGKVIQQRKICLADLREKLKRLHQAHTGTLRKLEEKQAAHTEKDDRLLQELVGELKLSEDTNKVLEKRYRELAENDPEVVNKLKEDIRETVSQINQWTDNLFNIRSWIKEKFATTEEAVSSMFNIPEDLDYVEGGCLEDS